MPEICEKCWNTGCKENEILRASKLEICRAFECGLIPAEAGEYVREGEKMDYKTDAQPKATAGGVPVFCAHDAIVAIEKLIPNPKNPNTHPDAQIQALGRIIRQTGWRAPITVSKRSGFIVKGHGRLAAAKLEGLTEVPADYQNNTNEAE